MPLYKLIVNDNIYCSGGVIPKGASVEVPAAPGRHMDYDDAKDAFVRKYGLRPSTQGIQLNCDKIELK